MVPMTRSGALGAPDMPRQVLREASWQLVASETQSERELSEEPASSYDEEAEFRSGSDGGDYEKQQAQHPQERPEDHEDILHPLREAANRVGREVERFAEVLDGYNPLRATAQEERHEMTVELIELYHNIAVDTLNRLRERHCQQQPKSEARRWKRKVRGFSVDHDEDVMDTEEFEQEPALSGDAQTTIEDLQHWEQETQTWDLLRRLVQLRFPSPVTEPDLDGTRSRCQPIHEYSSEREVWDSFLETDGLALERKTVLQWLKDSADDSGEDIDVLVQDLQQNSERGDIIAHGWLHTKAAIKNQKRTHSWHQPLDPSTPEVQRARLSTRKTEPLVTQLDPDAPTRQNRKLEVQDEYFERSIWLGCYEMLRRGRSREAIREWCAERTEVWRAVSMSSLPYDDTEDEEDAVSVSSSALWRRMCFSLCRKKGGDEYQRAVYGILSGDISSVEPVCNSWNDLLFVHYNALLRAQFDHYVQKVKPNCLGPASKSDFEIFDAVQFHGEPSTTGKRLVEGLKTDQRTITEMSQPMKMLQGVLIGNQFEHFIYQQGLALSKFANADGLSSLMPAKEEQPENEDITKYVALDDHDSLRVLTHVLLVFIGLGMDLGGYARETEVENVIVAYISFLRLAGKEELIPLYSSQLSGARKYAVLSRNLIDMTDHDQRVTQIQLMRELGLDVQEFVKMQSRYLLDDYEDCEPGYPATGKFTLFEDVQTESGVVHRVKKDFFGDDPDVVERIDMLFIRSLEWYLLVDGLWSETFTVGTILYLRFFKHMHLSAARMLASRVHSVNIARSKTRAILGESLDFGSLESSEEEDVTEVLSGSTNQMRQIKKILLAEARSFRELEIFTENLDNIETITSMASLMTESHASTWQKGWRQELARAFVPTRSSAQYLLNGWLLKSQNGRQPGQLYFYRELTEYHRGISHGVQIASRGISPETILAYIGVLQFGGSALTRDFLMECMDLSARIADKESDLLELFLKTGRMQELVEAFASASKSLLLITSAKQGPVSRSKKLRAKGWKQELWSVRQ